MCSEITRLMARHSPRCLFQTSNSHRLTDPVGSLFTWMGWARFFFRNKPVWKSAQLAALGAPSPAGCGRDLICQNVDSNTNLFVSLKDQKMLVHEVRQYCLQRLLMMVCSKIAKNNNVVRISIMNNSTLHDHTSKILVKLEVNFCLSDWIL